MNNLYLEHHGILGQKWGIRRFQNNDGSLTDAGKKRRSYSSTGLRSAIAKAQNRKVDKGFERWKEGAANRESAIELGKTANQKKLAYESDKKNKQAKAEYKEANKAYKQAYSKNTTHRKGQVRGEVGSDLSRKYLSAAKKVEKELQKDPHNRQLQKEYSRLMSKHDVERAKARKAPEVGARRSRQIAGVKRSVTIAVKSAVTAGVVGAGLAAAKKYGNVNISSEDFQKYSKMAAKAFSFMY